MQFASYFRPFPSMAGAMCGIALVLSGCGDSQPPEAEPPSTPPAVVQQSPKPASVEPKTSAAKETVTHGGAGEGGSTSGGLLSPQPLRTSTRPHIAPAMLGNGRK